MNIGAAFQQQPRRVDVAASAREQDRGHAALVRPVGLGAIVQEPRYRIDVASLRRSVQREIDQSFKRFPAIDSLRMVRAVGSSLIASARSKILQPPTRVR